MKLADGLKLAGGGLMLVSGFMAWGEWSAGGSGNAFDFFLRGAIPWVLTVGIGALTFLLITESISDDAPWELISLIAAALALGLIVAFIVDPTKGGMSIDRGIGAYLGLIASATVLVGSVLGYRNRPVRADDDDDGEYDIDAVSQRRSHPPLP
jgi:hypothetical protein